MFCQNFCNKVNYSWKCWNNVSNFKQDFILGHNKISPDLNNDPDEVSKFHNAKVSTFNTNGFWFLPNILMFFTKYGKFQCNMADCHNQDEYLENRNNQIVV